MPAAGRVSVRRRSKSSGGALSQNSAAPRQRRGEANGRQGEDPVRPLVRETPRWSSRRLARAVRACEEDALSVAPVSQIRQPFLLTMTISRASRNGRTRTTTKLGSRAMSCRLSTIPEPLRERQARALLKPENFRLGFGERRQRQDSTSSTQRVLEAPARWNAARAGSHASLTPRAAASRNMAGARFFGELAKWTSLDDESLSQAILDCGESKPDQHGEARFRPAIVRAHDRISGRAQNPDDPRLRRAIAAALSVSRPTSWRISRSSTGT